MFEAKSLSCRRNGRLVFREVGLRLAPGTLLQITGTNGSGKSSLLRILAGLLPAAKGEVLWDGAPLSNNPDEHRNRLHYIGHLDALKPELTGDEMLAYWRALRPTATVSQSDPFGIHAFRQKPIRYLSAGQKRRLTMSRLTQDNAPLWLLDEPTTALDTAGQDLLFQTIAAHRAKGGIVIAAVHHMIDMPEVQTLNMPESFRVPSPLAGRAREGLGNTSADLSPLAQNFTSPPCIPPVNGGEVPTPPPVHNFLHSVFKNVHHDLKLHTRQMTDWVALLLFFIIVIMLLPFALGPEPDLLRRLAPGLIWLASLLMSLLSLDKLFVQDARDGTLDLMLLSPLPLPLIVASKLFAQSLTMLIALGLMTLPAAAMLGMSFSVLPVLGLSLLLGLPALVLLGGIAGSITVALHRNPALLTLLLVPFYIPILIFAVSACDAAALHAPPWPHLALLGAILAVLLPTAPFTIAAALRQGS